MLGDSRFVTWLDPREELFCAMGVWALFIGLSTILVSSLWREQLKLSYEGVAQYKFGCVINSHIIRITRVLKIKACQLG